MSKRSVEDGLEKRFANHVRKAKTEKLDPFSPTSCKSHVVFLGDSLGCQWVFSDRSIYLLAGIFYQVGSEYKLANSNKLILHADQVKALFDNREEIQSLYFKTLEENKLRTKSV